MCTNEVAPNWKILDKRERVKVILTEEADSCNEINDNDDDVALL